MSNPELYSAITTTSAACNASLPGESETLMLKGGWIFDDLDIEKYVQRIESNVVSYLLRLS